jgi:hypothetical protein
MATRRIPYPRVGHKHVSAPKVPHTARARSRRHIAGDRMAGGIESEQRHAMISEAAYFLSEQGGFCPGRQLEDWLSAEKDIDRSPSSGETVSACGDRLGNAVP